jgi:hypothetical protein
MTQPIHQRFIALLLTLFLAGCATTAIEKRSLDQDAGALYLRIALAQAEEPNQYAFQRYEAPTYRPQATNAVQAVFWLH